MTSPVRVLVPAGMLGAGFTVESIERGIALGAHVIAIDGGSTDSGPAYLATASAKVPAEAIATSTRACSSCSGGRFIGSESRSCPPLGGSADAGGLWIALHAAHAHVDFSVVVLAYVAGVVASWVPLLPGGLGAVEIAVPAVLHHFGVPLTVALTGTLLWRGLSLFLPAIGGALAYASLRAQPVIDT